MQSLGAERPHGLGVRDGTGAPRHRLRGRVHGRVQRRPPRPTGAGSASSDAAVALRVMSGRHTRGPRSRQSRRADRGRGRRPPRRVATSPAKRASAIASSSSPRRGPGREAELSRELVAAHERLRRRRPRAGERRGEHARGPASRWRGDRLVGLAPARREPVGDATAASRRPRPARWRAGSGRRRARSSGRLVHEEAEAQVVAGQRGDVRAQALAGPQAREHRRAPARRRRRRGRGSRRARRAARSRVCGLAASCSSAPKRSAAAARELVGQRLGEQRADRRRRLVAERRRRVALELDRPLEHLERVAVDVEVVVAGSARRRAARRARAARRGMSPSSSIARGRAAPRRRRRPA